MISIDAFSVARLFLVAAASWTAALWLSSDFLLRLGRQVLLYGDRGEPLVSPRTKGYRYWKYGVCLLIGFVTLWSMKWVANIELTKRLKTFNDILIPANDSNPETDCDNKHPLPPAAVVFYLGHMRFAAPPGRFPWTVLVTANGVRVLTLERDPAGNIGMDLEIRSSDGKIIAKIEQNHFVVNVNNILTMYRPDVSTLLVKDQEGNQVVRLRVMNKNRLSFTGSFYLDGRGYPVVISDAEVNVGTYSFADFCAPYYEGPEMMQLIIPER